MNHVHIVVACLFALSALQSTVSPAHAQETKTEGVRPEVGKPLQAAQELIRGKKYKEALTKIGEADAVAGKTGYESYVIERLRASAAMQAGDNEQAIKAVGALLASGRVPAAEQLKLIEAVVGMYYRAKDYAKTVIWAQRYFKDGGGNPQMHTLLVQALYLNNEYAAAAKELQADIQAEEKAGQTPGEDRLQLLASCYLKMNDAQGYIHALERLVAHYPKKEYWADLIYRIEKKPGYAERLALDAYRLRHAVGILTTPADYMEMAQLAIQAGFPAQAKRVLDQGFTRGTLGAGGEAARHKRLAEMAARSAAEDQKSLAQAEAAAYAAKDGNGQINTGFNYVLLGQYEKGLAVMEEGMKKGGLKRPEEAALHIGMAYMMAGQKDKGRQALLSVRGSGGTADLARLWIIFFNAPRQ
jgi:hypothetical protein